MFSVGKLSSGVERDQEPQGLAESFQSHIYGNPTNSVNLPPPQQAALADFFSNRANPYQNYNFPNHDAYFSQQHFTSYQQIPQKQDNGFGILYPEQYTGANVITLFYLLAT